MILFLIILNFLEVNSQGLSDIKCMNLNASVLGKKVTNYKNSSTFAILIQDTCSSFNRFDNNFYSFPEISVSKLKYYKAVIVDSILWNQLEKSFLEDSQISKLGSQDQNYQIRRKLLKYITIVSGFVNDLGDTCFVSQFLTKKEFKSDPTFSKQMNLLANQKKEISFFIVRKIKNNFVLDTFFPPQLLNIEN
jgi:hypothetical protein